MHGEGLMGSDFNARIRTGEIMKRNERNNGGENKKIKITNTEGKRSLLKIIAENGWNVPNGNTKRK